MVNSFYHAVTRVKIRSGIVNFFSDHMSFPIGGKTGIPGVRNPRYRYS